MHAMRFQWRDFFLVALILLIGGAAKAWIVDHSEVMAKDGISYVQYAVRLDAEPWPTVLRESEYHPLYPIHVLGFSKVIPPREGEPAPLHWQRSAQWANLVFGTLLAVPMYLIGLTLFGRAPAFWAALAFQLLPVPARIMADALSEGAYLFWGTSALLFAVWGMRGSWKWFVPCGVCGGLSYLARPEAGIIVICIGFVLAVTPLIRRTSVSWRACMLGNAALVAAALVIMGPFWLIIGRLTTKPTANQLLETAASPQAPPSKDPYSRGSLASAEPAGKAGFLFAARFTPGANGVGTEGVTYWYALLQVGDELWRSTLFVLWLPMVIGLIAFWRKILNQPAAWLLLVVLLANTAVICRLALVAGYVSERHTLMILLCGTLFASAGCFAVGDWWWNRRAATAANIRLGWKTEFLGPGMAMALVILIGCIQTLRPLHPHRAGHKEAGFWLAEQLREGDQLVDTNGWAAYYSGYSLHHLKREKPKPVGSANVYVVREPNDIDSTRAHLVKEAIGNQDLGPPVYSWSKGKAPELEVSFVPALPQP